MKQAVLIWILVALGMALGVLVDVTYAAELTGSITGNVVNSQTTEPVAKIAVTLVETGAIAYTDSRGRFTFDAVAVGNYELRIESTGYERKQVTGITVSKGVTTRLSIVLVPLVQKDKEEKAPARLRGYTAQDSQSAAGTDYKKDEVALGKSLMAIKPQVESYNAPNEERQSTNSTGNYRDQNLQQVPKRIPAPTYSYETIPATPQDMFFRDYGTNGFVETRRDPRSTFAADIDDASFTLARRYLTEGNMPPSDAIRVEEFLNHFDYNYNPPDEGKFRIFSELATSPFDGRATYLKIGIKGREISESHRKPMRLTAVIDVSGSMGYDNRFEVLKRSLTSLISRLDSEDRIAIVSYGSYATEVLSPTPGDEQSDIMSALYSLYPGGSTFAEAGLRLGYQVANRQFTPGANNIVILLSDGVANVGRTSPDAIMKEINQFARKGLTLSTFGFGMGNYNDVLLEQLAKQGNGSYAYIDNYEEGQKLFADRLVSTTQLLARDVKIQVEFNPSTVSSYRLIGYENRAVADNKFRDNKQDGGEIKAGHEVTALYELIINRRGRDAQLATINVRWTNLAQEEVTEVSQDVVMPRHITSFANARAEFRLAVAATRFAELLKGTEFTDGCFAGVLQIARRISNEKPSEQTRELCSLIERAQSLSNSFGRVYQED